MKRLFILTLTFAVGSQCTSQSGSHVSTNNVSQSTPAPSPSVGSEAPASDSNKKEDVPLVFKDYDFSNLAYPTSFGRARVRLKDGTYERAERGGGGDTFDFRSVNFVDLNGDGRKEAIVQLTWVSCGVSCDGGTDLFYFYAITNGRLTLLSRLEIGSYAYDCGLKSLRLRGRELALETFRSCRFNGSGFTPQRNDPEERISKLVTNRYTKFHLHFNGRRFIQDKREVFSFPEEHNFSIEGRKIEISDD